jgi:hypothetical protein
MTRRRRRNGLEGQERLMTPYNKVSQYFNNIYLIYLSKIIINISLKKKISSIFSAIIHHWKILK